MFVNAIRIVEGFTRPIRMISRNYGSGVVTPGAGTMFFVNEEGYAVTCAHVAREIVHADEMNRKYRTFRAETASLKKDGRYQSEMRLAEKRYGLQKDKCAQMKFAYDGVGAFESITITVSGKYDIAILKFNELKGGAYTGHAVFAKDNSLIEPGKMMCRLGFPFPEFSNFTYDAGRDDILWTEEGKRQTPRFPIEGMITRHIADQEGQITGIELSTPGLRGQSGGPLFAENGVIYGMQSSTHHLYLGFDIHEKRKIGGREEMVNNQPFLHVGQCVHLDVIKQFLDENHIRYYVGDSIENAQAVQK